MNDSCIFVVHSIYCSFFHLCQFGWYIIHCKSLWLFCFGLNISYYIIRRLLEFRTHWYTPNTCNWIILFEYLYSLPNQKYIKLGIFQSNQLHRSNHALFLWYIVVFLTSSNSRTRCTYDCNTCKVCINSHSKEVKFKLLKTQFRRSFSRLTVVLIILKIVQLSISLSLLDRH